MKLEWLECFCAVVETGSFRKAAAQLHRTQPAVSQQIKALERQVRQRVLDRRTGRPTPVGQVLYERARHLLTESDSLARELADFDENAVRGLRVGTSDTNALYFLPRFVRAFSLRMPDTHLVVICRSSDAVAEQVRRGELDLGIVTLPSVSASDELESRELFEQRFVLVAPQGHWVGTRRRVSLKQLRDEPFLMLEAHTRIGGLVQTHLQRHGFEPRVVLDSGSFEVIKRYVAEGIGLAFLPEDSVIGEALPLEIVTVPGLPKVSIGAIWRRHAYQTAAELTFLDLIAGRP